MAPSGQSVSLAALKPLFPTTQRAGGGRGLEGKAGLVGAKSLGAGGATPSWPWARPPTLWILSLALFPSLGESWCLPPRDTVDKQHKTTGARSSGLNPGPSTHDLGNLDCSTSLGLSAPICKVGTVVSALRRL